MKTQLLTIVALVTIALNVHAQDSAKVNVLKLNVALDELKK
jgi:hypothetical protein